MIYSIYEEFGMNFFHLEKGKRKPTASAITERCLVRWCVPDSGYNS